MHRTMIRNRKEAGLVPWIAAASDSLKRHRRGPCCPSPAVVERPDRRPDHQTQARQATDVRQSKDRSPSRLIGATRAMVNIIEIASEPKLDADTGSNLNAD
jgi:hypothetical protein